MHMTQHVLLTMLAPPLLLLANPLPVMLWGLPTRLRHRLGGLLTRQALLRRVLWAWTRLPVAWLLYVSTLWGWYHPVAYQAALRHELVHDVEHLMFFGTGVLFWWPVINPAPRLQGHIAYGWRMLYVFLAAGQNTLLAALLSLTERVLYPYYLDVPRVWGLPAIDDQAIGGAIMWVVGGMMYPITLLVLVACFLNEDERLTLQREAKTLKPRGAVKDPKPENVLIFDLAINSMDMSLPSFETYDFKSNVVLETDRGVSVRPIDARITDWGHMGHHPRGTIIFPSQVGGVSMLGSRLVRVTLRGLGGAEKRVFEWKIPPDQ
jgi:hypothetical protein